MLDIKLITSTVGGASVRNLHVDTSNNDFPIKGEYRELQTNKWRHCKWTYNGKRFLLKNDCYDLNIANKEATDKVINTYENGKPKIYLSAPITGVANYDKHFQLLKQLIAETKFETAEYVPASPIDLPHPAIKTHAEYMRQCLRLLMDCDALLLGLGWQNSRGCLSEFNAAITIDIPIFIEQFDAVRSISSIVKFYNPADNFPTF